MKTKLPKGVKDLLPNTALKRTTIVSKVLKAFNNAGYKRIITPTFELYDTLKYGLGQSLDENCIRFFIGEDLMVLRPDMTVPVARLVAREMKEIPLPIKLCYAGNVFRKQKTEMIHHYEFYQLGIELIGEKGYKADAGVIVLAVKALKAMGIKNFEIEIGHTDFTKSLSFKKKQALSCQNYSEFGSIPEIGGVKIIKNNKYFMNIYNILKKNKVENHVKFNTGLLRDINYYTGIIFEVYLSDYGYLVGSGGRYDNLLGMYGYPQPAVGFALNLDRILMSQKLV